MLSVCNSVIPLTSVIVEQIRTFGQAPVSGLIIKDLEGVLEQCASSLEVLTLLKNKQKKL